MSVSVYPCKLNICLFCIQCHVCTENQLMKLDCIGISFLSPCRGGIYDAHHSGFDKSNPYRSAPKVRYVHENGGCFITTTFEV